MNNLATDKYAMREIDVRLYNACAKGTVQEVERLICLGADPSVPHWEKPWPEDLDENLYTEDYYCVHEAAMNPDVGILNSLVKHGADPNMREYWGRQPLAYAGCYNSFEVVRRLVELGNDPDNCDDDGGTVLSWAALNPDVRVLDFLIEHGAEVGAACYGEMELDIALKSGSPDRVRYFIGRRSELLKSVSTDSVVDAPLENIRALLECGFDPNQEDGYGDGRIVNFLDPVRKALFVEFGAKVY